MAKLSMRSLLLACLCLRAGIHTTEAKSVQLDEGVRQFIGAYCINCHGPDKAKGDRAFHQLANLQDGKWLVDLENDEKVDLLRDVLDQLNLGEMPPRKKNVKQPPFSEVKPTIAWLTTTMLDWEKAKGPATTTLRRLNRREYRNTMRDLLGLRAIPFDLTENFPADDQREGFTNLGDALTMSDAHLDAYLEAADKYLRMAFRFGEKEESKTLRISPETWGYPEREGTTPWMYRVHYKDQYLDVGAGKKQLSDNFSLGTPPNGFARQGGVQVSGYYKISVSAEAVRRLTHPYDPKMIPVDLTPPMQLGLYVSDGVKGLASDAVKSRKRLGLWDLLDHQRKTFEVTVWLDKGNVPFLNWDNGPGPSDYWMRDILKKYHTDIEFRGKQGAHAWHIVGKNAVPGRLVSDVWKGPVLRMHDFRLSGPHPYTFKSNAQRVFLDGATDLSEANLSLALQRFARLAFRRPVTAPEVQPYLAIEKHARETLGRKPEEAFLLAFKAILVSPDFLYLKEKPSADNQLGPFEVANRLSYFLWSSMPDHELFELARSKRILIPNVLRQQVDRMLKDYKSRSFVEGFATSWLRLDKLGSMPVDRDKFREYYRNGLEEAMTEETHRFLAHAIQANAPLRDFIHSDYSFLNQDLARHYGIPGVQGLRFRKVNLPANGIRGGLLGQASILTLTANGVDTSPVVRGIWVLENLLGTPPPPPPPDVEPIDPDVRGAKTIKQLMEKHRSIESCADCHAKIDPFGFPLEFFDPVGGHRPTYYKVRRWTRPERKTTLVPSLPVDGSATLPSGERFTDPLSLKKVLLGKMDFFSKALTEKMLTYATGRTATYRDQAEIQAIAKSALVNGKGFRDLVTEVAASQSFRQK